MSQRSAGGSRSLLPSVSVLLSILFLASLPALAADERAGTVRGTVRSSHSGEPLHYANVVLVGTGRGAPTDAQGVFAIVDVPPGRYEIEASYVGYERVRRTIVVEAGTGTSVEFSLREDFFRTGEIIVTATRTDRLLEDLPMTVELIGRAEIDEKGSESLADILEYRPGITAAAGNSGEQFIYLNGVDSKRILVLVDNIPLSGKLYDRISLNRIDSDLIDRVEIVKGPGSAIYGSSAMGGVINVITRPYSSEPSLSLRGRTGSNGLLSGTGILSGRAARIEYLLSADYLLEGDYQTVNEMVVDETRTAGVDAKLRIDGGPAGSFELKGGYQDDRIDSESLFMGRESDNVSSSQNTGSSLRWQREIGSRGDAAVTGFYTGNERIYEYEIRGSMMPAQADTTTDDIYGFKSDIGIEAFDALRLDAGVDYSENDYENARLGSEITRRESGVFLQAEAEPVPDLTVIAGVRYDWITDVDPYLSPRASAIYRAGERLKVRGAWGRGFRAPSFIELYSYFQMPIPGMPIFVVGNPDLSVETSEGLSLGAEYLFGDLLLASATLFRSEFDDMIVDYQADPLTFSYLNVESATIQGVETQGRLYLTPNLTATLSYSYTDIDKEGDVAISTISPHTGLLAVTWGVFGNRLRLSLREQYFGEREILVVSGEAGGYETERKEAYNIVDMTVSWSVSEHHRLRLGARNLGDYTDAGLGPYVGRRFFLGFEADLGGKGARR